MVKKIPILPLTEPERKWLELVLSFNEQGERPAFRLIWSKIGMELPKDFRPVQMDENLIDASGERIRLLGVVALEKNFSILDQCDKVIFAIKEFLLEFPDRTDFEVAEISEKTGLSIVQISFILNLISEIGSFWSNSSSEADKNYLLSIGIRGDSNIFYRYMSFTGIRELLLDLLNRQEQQKKEQKNQSKRTTPLPTPTKDKSGHWVQPLFHARGISINPKFCFVLMPFTEEWSDRVYKELIRKTVESMGIQCLRADNLTGPNIIEDIWVNINQAGFIIADVTNNNPNVMYELGIAHTVGTPTLLITQSIEKIPFDFKNLRHIQYRDNVDAGKKFRSELKRYCLGLYEERYPDVDIKLQK